MSLSRPRVLTSVLVAGFIALIAVLILKFLQLKSKFNWSLSHLVALLRQQLFVYRDLWVRIDNPFQPPPIPETLPEQLALQLAK